MLRRRDAPTERPRPEVAPGLARVVDLQAPLEALCAEGSSTGRRYAFARLLVVLDEEPLALVDLPLPACGLSADEVADALWARLGPQIRAARAARRLPVPERLPAAGLGAPAGTGERPVLDAAVVVATRERPALLDACLRSILDGDALPREVVVVDNAPATASTYELVADWAAREPRVRYVLETVPGLARAHNAALPHVTSAVAAFTDDDVLVDRRWLRRMVEAFDAADDVVCVTGLIVALELETLAQQWVDAHAGFAKGLTRRVIDLDEHRPEDPLFPYTAGVLGSGASMAFRSDYLRSVGGFDDALGAGTVALGGDDLASFYDVVRHGHRLVYEPAAVVAHRHPRDLAAMQRQAYGYGCGLGAHLTRCVLLRPASAVEMARVLPGGLRRAATVVRPPEDGALPPLPADLARRRIAGLAAGPVRYLRSRHAMGQGARR